MVSVKIFRPRSSEMSDGMISKLRYIFRTPGGVKSGSNTDLMNIIIIHITSIYSAMVLSLFYTE